MTITITWDAVRPWLTHLGAFAAGVAACCYMFARWLGSAFYP